MLSQKKSNFLLYNVYCFIETLSLYYFFSMVFKDRLLKKLLLFSTLFYTLVFIFSLIVFKDKSYFYNCIIFENISILAFAIYYYYRQTIVIDSAFIYSEPVFWVVTAYFIYIASTYFLYLYIPSLNSSDQEKYYLLNYLFIIVRTVLLSISMFVKPGSNKLDKKLNY